MVLSPFVLYEKYENTSSKHQVAEKALYTAEDLNVDMAQYEHYHSEVINFV